jgi:hypothetical protein
MQYEAGYDHIQARLNKFNSSNEGLIFSRVQLTINVLMNTLGSDHQPIITSFSIGNGHDPFTGSSFKLNVSHLSSKDFHALMHRI